MVLGRKVEKVVDIVGEILAMATIVLVVVMLANDKWGFIQLETAMYDILNTVKNFAIVAVLGLSALEFALKRNIIIFIICAAAIVVAFVFVFIPLF